MTFPRTQLITFIMLMAVACNRQGASETTKHEAQSAAARTSASSNLSLDDVFAWRSVYGDLMGKAKEAAIERYGKDFTQDGPNVLVWSQTPQTREREINIALSTRDADQIVAVKVLARSTETLDIIDVMKKAPLFIFDTGTYRDSTADYLVARTKDNRNVFQFDISERAVTFSAATFLDPDVGGNGNTMFKR